MISPSILIGLETVFTNKRISSLSSDARRVHPRRLVFEPGCPQRPVRRLPRSSGRAPRPAQRSLGGYSRSGGGQGGALQRRGEGSVPRRVRGRLRSRRGSRRVRGVLRPRRCCLQWSCWPRCSRWLQVRICMTIYGEVGYWRVTMLQETLLWMRLTFSFLEHLAGENFM